MFKYALQEEVKFFVDDLTGTGVVIGRRWIDHTVPVSYMKYLEADINNRKGMLSLGYDQETYVVKTETGRFYHIDASKIEKKEV